MRRLAITRRQVPLDIVDDYLAMWDALRERVITAGGRAWIFRGSGHQDRFIEFIEWSDEIAAPLSLESVADAAAELDMFAVPTSTDEWEEPRDLAG